MEWNYMNNENEYQASSAVLGMTYSYVVEKGGVAICTAH